jgi:hypothetical protein
LNLPGDFAFLPIVTSRIPMGLGGSYTIAGSLTWDFGVWGTPTASANGVTRQVGGPPLQLVSPSYVTAFGQDLPVFATLTIHAVNGPEASVPVLIGSAVAAGLVLRRR